MKSLSNLSVSDNQFTSNSNYRQEIFALIPNLELIDGYDKEGNQEAEESFDSDEDDDD